jgi:DNA-binding NarL/FixJ family response regulator
MLLQESLRERRDLGTPEDLANGFANLAVVAVMGDDAALAAQLFAAEETLRNRIGSRRKLPERAVYERAAATARDVLGAESFAMATRRGEELSLDQHIAAALAFAPSPPAEGSLPDQPPHDRLTPRERDVLRLLVLGRTNPEIAEELFISPSTARVHVSNILAKLDARTRTQAADLARRLGLV